MKEQVEDFLANLLGMGMSKESAIEKAYVYALALQTDQQPRDANSIPASFMSQAARWVREALPGAYRIHEMRNRMW